MTLEERMLNGKLYDCADEKLQAQQRALNELVFGSGRVYKAGWSPIRW